MSDPITLAAQRVDDIADKVARGDIADPMGDQVTRCANYYANALGVPVEEIEAARRR
ncbi:hypothetical protein ACWELB_21185 [Streptomyces asiaticus]